MTSIFHYARMETILMQIKRDFYLNQLINKMGNGLTKVITGVHRCGKSYLLMTLFRNYLLDSGVPDRNIICMSFDEDTNSRYRNPVILGEYLRSLATDATEKYYFLLDEVQLIKNAANPDCPGDIIGFSQVLIGLSNRKNCDVYVTGSNSKFLSKDILTEFRGKNDQIHIYPLSFKEYMSVSHLSTDKAFAEYLVYGGLPGIVDLPAREKEQYLKSLFTETYSKDIVERYHVERPEVLENIMDFLSSSVSSLTNPNNITKGINIYTEPKASVNTVSDYISHLEECFIISTAKRYDIKGKTYFDYPNKYYFTDTGLRNARLNFRQLDRGHLMENAIYNELIRRGYSVDVGGVYDENRRQREIDFVVNLMDCRIYIQSAYQIDDEESLVRETKSFKATKDSFRKICLRNDLLRNYYDDNGIYHLSVTDFLLGEEI